MKTRDEILDKVRKLFALGTNSGATENERETAMRQAHSILLKHNLEASDVPGEAKIEERRGITRVQFYGRPWARTVASAAAKLMLCDYLCMLHEEAKLTTHIFIGKESNAAAAQAMARWLIEQLQGEGKRRNRSEGTGRNNWYRSFCVGAANTIHYRVENMIRDAAKAIEAPTTGTALVVANLYRSEAEANAVVRAQAFPQTKISRRGSSRVSHDAIASGAAFGRSVHLSRDVAPASAKKLN